MLNYRKIEKGDDKKIAQIIRANLEKFHLDIPGTHIFFRSAYCLGMFMLMYLSNNFPHDLG